MFLSVLPANHFYHIFHIFYYVQSVVATTYIVIFFTVLQVLNSFTPVINAIFGLENGRAGPCSLCDVG